MAIELEGGLNVVVPESLTHSLDVYACLKEERGVSMAKAMQRNRGQRCSFADSASEAPTDDVRILRQAARPAEH